jgi:hypothetical protein
MRKYATVAFFPPFFPVLNLTPSPPKGAVEVDVYEVE